LPTLLAFVCYFALLQFQIRPYIFEAFIAPSNSMAPTLLGPHVQGTCPQCGAPNYGTYFAGSLGTRFPQRMICDQFHVATTSDFDNYIYPSDRFLVAKFLPPRRWDLVVFQFPGDPSRSYVMRLVGLPGETIHLEDGAVWINGEKLTPPESLQGIEYSSPSVRGTRFQFSGSAERPAKLADDEYFVLGDFSEMSNDSRLWLQGAPGHNPFAVPQSYLQGVVTHIYWPPERWRALR
jgi:signal peptidase I